VSFFRLRGERKSAFTIVKEGRQATVKSRWRRRGARRDNGAQYGTVFVSLHESGRDGERRGCG